MKKTQLERVKNKLKESGYITRNQCLSTYPAITRLSAIMLLLKEEGWEYVGYSSNRDYVYKLVSYPQNKITTLQQ